LDHFDFERVEFGGHFPSWLSLIGSVRRWMPGFLVSNKLRINDFANTVLEDMEEIGHDS